MEFSRDQETSIQFQGDWNRDDAQTLLSAWHSALAMEFKIPEWIRYMEGASGKKYRYMINNYLGMLEDARYLEIGTWAGSTTCSAIYGNKVRCHAMDNWAEFGGPKDKFFEHINKAKLDSPDLDFTFTEASFQNVDFSSIGKFNVYLFDGPHEEVDQYNGLALAQPALDDTFVFICDDWNWARVRAGTFRAIEELGLTNIASMEIRTRQEESWHCPDLMGTASDWHNGYFVAILRKGQQ
jgi:hypothetical protein